MTYGTLELSAHTLTILAIVTALMFFASAVAYAACHDTLGLVLQFATFVPLLILVASWFTEISHDDWYNLGIWPPVGAIVLCAAVVILPRYIAEYFDL